MLSVPHVSSKGFFANRISPGFGTQALPRSFGADDVTTKENVCHEQFKT